MNPPTVVPTATPELLAARFWAKVDKRGDDECWPWLGATNGPMGHGQLTVQQRRHYAHRVSWELHHGPIGEGLVVCHSCDNPPCVNPAHLFVGSQRDNMADMIRKGRGAKPGSRTHCPSGHPLSGDNLYVPPGTQYKHCRVCRQRASERARVRCAA